MSSTGQQTRRHRDSAPAGRVQPADNKPGAAKDSWQAKMPPRRTWLWFVLIVLANYFLVRLLMPSPEGPVTVPYTLFKQEVSKGNVEAIHSQGDTITGRFKAPVTYPPAGEQGASPQGEPRPSGQQPAAPGGPPLPAGEPGAAPIKLGIKDGVYEFVGGSTRVFTLGRAGT
jgi:cell division protease FtsH